MSLTGFGTISGITSNSASVHSFSFLKDLFIYFREGERESTGARGVAEGEREGKNFQQTLC